MKDSIVKINKDVYFLEGAARGAIYNLADGKVYSINNEACRILNEYLARGEVSDFLKELEDKRLFDKNIKNIVLSKERQKARLEFVWLELTMACNLRCVHCYDGDEHKQINGCLSYDEWKSVLEQLKGLESAPAVEFIGGEPLAYPHFVDLLKYALSLDLNVEIYSNLTLFSEELLKIAKDNNVKVHFSLYSARAQVHDAITQTAGSFSTLLYWLKRLSFAGVELIGSTTIMKINQGDICAMNSLVRSLGINRPLNIDIVRSVPEKNTCSLLPDEETAVSFMRSKPNFYVARDRFFSNLYGNSCLFGKFAIMPNGDVIPCEFARDVIYGNLKVFSIAQILSSDLLQKYWYLSSDNIDECKNCEYRYACKDCRFLSKDIYGKNPRCLYNPESGVWGDKPQPR